MNFETPIIFIIYNRPSLTERVFEVIKKIKPTQLFIIADGPKDTSDKLLCDQARNIIHTIDWDVDLKTNFSDTNLGCTQRIVSGLDWAFEQVEAAIILEDDCLPHVSFFNFCIELLEYYKNDEQIMHISGCNILQRNSMNNASYFFSNYALPPWGWATWKRAWQKFDHQLDGWQKHKKEIHPHISQVNFKKWTDTFEHIRINKVTWDIPWNVDIWVNNGLVIIPNNNMVTNIGYGEYATFTKKANSRFANLITTEIQSPLIHPKVKAPSLDQEIETICIEMLKEIE